MPYAAQQATAQQATAQGTKCGHSPCRSLSEQTTWQLFSPGPQCPMDCKTMHLSGTNVHIGLINAREIKTNGGPKKISKCTWNKDKHPLPAPKKSPPKKRKRERDRRGEIAKPTPGPWIFGTLFLQSQIVSFTKPMFSYISLLLKTCPQSNPQRG